MVIEMIKSPEFEQLHQYLVELEKIIIPGKSVLAKNKPKVLTGIK